MWLPVTFRSPLSLILDLILDSTASKWTHWATFWRHFCLLRAAASVSFQVSPILWRSFLMMPLQFVIGWPVPLLDPGTSQYSACWRSIRIRWWSPQSSFTDNVVYVMLSSSCPDFFIVILSFHETPSCASLTQELKLLNLCALRFLCEDGS